MIHQNVGIIKLQVLNDHIDGSKTAVLLFSFILIEIHSIQARKATPKHGVIRKRRKQRWKAYTKAVWKEPKNLRCLLTLDLTPFRS